jgi:hypothetical protein
MRKISLKFWVFAFALLYIASACKKHTGPDVPAQYTSTKVEQARKWFENQIKKTALVGNNHASAKTAWNSRIQPSEDGRALNWSSAKVTNFGDEEVIEVPMTFLKKRGYSLSAQKQVPDNSNYAEAITSLVLKQKTNHREAFVMSIIPDSEYKSNQYKTLANNSYRNLEREYSGAVLLHEWQGDFKAGWRVRAGNRAFSLKSVAELTGRSQIVNTTGTEAGVHMLYAAPDCQTIEVLEWFQDCTDYYYNGAYSHSACGAPYSEHVTYYQHCSYEGGSGGGGSGSSEAEEGIVLGPEETTDRLDCKTFAFTRMSPTSNAYESGINAVKIYGSYPSGLIVKELGDIYLQVPYKKKNGQRYTPGEAANLAAKAMNSATAALYAKHALDPQGTWVSLPESTIRKEYFVLIAAKLTSLFEATCTVTRDAKGLSTSLRKIETSFWAPYDC